MEWWMMPLLVLFGALVGWLSSRSTHEAEKAKLYGEISAALESMEERNDAARVAAGNVCAGLFEVHQLRGYIGTKKTLSARLVLDHVAAVEKALAGEEESDDSP